MRPGDKPGLWRSDGESMWVEARAPYQPGDILWVRETWQAVYETEWSEEHPFTGENIRKPISNIEFERISKEEAEP